MILHVRNVLQQFYRQFCLWNLNFKEECIAIVTLLIANYIPVPSHLINNEHEKNVKKRKAKRKRNTSLNWHSRIVSCILFAFDFVLGVPSRHCSLSAVQAWSDIVFFALQFSQTLPLRVSTLRTHCIRLGLQGSDICHHHSSSHCLCERTE